MAAAEPQQATSLAFIVTVTQVGVLIGLISDITATAPGLCRPADGSAVPADRSHSSCADPASLWRPDS
jgi:hypothetical protein